MPPELEAVIRRCLAPEPADRYPNAAALAADLQAVADDAPLRLAREPLPSRSVRWVRRNRLRLAVAVPLALAPTVVLLALGSAQLERAKIAGQRTGQVEQLIAEGKRLMADNRIEAAEVKFATAFEMAEDARDPDLQELEVEARDKHRLAQEIERTRDAADAVLARGRPAETAACWASPAPSVIPPPRSKRPSLPFTS